MIAFTPPPPYYAVIFTTIRASDHQGYEETAQNMHELAKAQPGFLGLESSRSDIGITVSYWASEKAIHQWKQQADHLIAQQQGRERWYASYHVRVARVERAYSFHE